MKQEAITTFSLQTVIDMFKIGYRLGNTDTQPLETDNALEAVAMQHLEPFTLKEWVLQKQKENM